MNSIRKTETELWRAIALMIALIATLAAVACGKVGGDGGNGSDAQYAAVPNPDMNQCNPNTARNANWQTYQQWNISPYGYAYAYQYQTSTYSYPSAGLCNCPSGTYPACGPQGLMCVPVNSFSGQSVAVWSYSHSQGGGYTYKRNGWHHPHGRGRHGRHGRYPNGGSNGGSSCHSAVAVSCQAGQVNGDLICQAVASGSPVGVWVRR